MQSLMAIHQAWEGDMRAAQGRIAYVTETMRHDWHNRKCKRACM